MTYTSRKPEPYIQANCKSCSTPIEFLPKAGVKNTKVEVQCWSCNGTNSYDIDATGTKVKQNANKPTSKWSKKKGTGKGKKKESICLSSS